MIPSFDLYFLCSTRCHAFERVRAVVNTPPLGTTDARLAESARSDVPVSLRRTK